MSSSEPRHLLSAPEGRWTAAEEGDEEAPACGRACCSRLPPRALVVLLGALTTPATAVLFAWLRNVWLTFAAVATLWVGMPLAVCCTNAPVRQVLRKHWRRGLRRPGFQVSVAVPLALGIVGSALLTYRYVARYVVDVDSLRAKLADYGLSDADPAPDVIALLWLTFLNPIMEEGFWRVFCFQLLLRDGGGEDRRRWWTAALAVSVLYAAYHLPVVWNFLPLALVLGCGVGLTLLGLALQRVVERLGLIVAIVAHGACDAVVSVIVADVVWSWGLVERTRRR